MAQVRTLPTGRVRCPRRVGAMLKRLLVPKGLFAKRATGRPNVQRRPVMKIQAKEEELDWTEKSREVFETALDKGKDYAKSALDAWESAEDKPAVIAITLVVLTAVYAANATLGAMENVPFVGGSLKIIGLYVSGWFCYRMIAFEADRQELVDSLDSLTKKIIGK